MWKIREEHCVCDRWETGYWIVNVIGKKPDGKEITVQIPHLFDDETLAHAIRDKLNDGDSICNLCANFRNGSCACNCEDECEEGYYEAFELAEEEEDDIEYERVKRSEIEKPKKGRLQKFSRRFDFWATAALMIIAAIVFAGLTKDWNMWGAISLYWAVLTISRMNLWIAKGWGDERE